MLKHISSSQLSEWMVYDEINSIDNKRWRDELIWSIAQLNSNMNNIAIRIHGKKGTQLTKPEDFLSKWGTEENEKEKEGYEKVYTMNGIKYIKKQSIEEMKKFILGVSADKGKKK